VVSEAEPAVSRLGGDEFTILLSMISEPEDAAEVARRILDSLPSPVSIDGHKVSTTGSIGIAIYPMDGEDVETLVKHADTAMYHAKNRGLNNFAFFDSSMNAAVLRKLMLESRLLEAVDRDELRLHYQPRLDLRSGRVTGMEGLLRWEHPELGMISPREFIPLSEESGLIVPIGEWAMYTACRQNAEWNAQGYEKMLVSVNVSARQIALIDLRETVAGALRETGFDPHYLEIEITESMALQDDEETAAVLRDIRSMGVRIALDDFGAGYSSLRYFTRLPLDTLKLDRCLVRDLGSDPAAANVAGAVIAMAHSLGLQAVAEGVDAEEQAVILRERDCDEMQGFLFSGAVPAEEFVRFLRRASDSEDG
jgi:predicted signal transduction protein with EAL and GGDEF domain